MKNSRKVILIFLAILTLVNFIFNWRLVKGTFNSDATITEFVVETAYQGVSNGENPFTRTYRGLYPFGMNFSLNDPGIGVLPYYALFRQFTNVHGAMMLVLLTNISLTGLLMFIYLKNLKMTDFVAGFGSLVFTFTPFISHRLLGHYTYVCLFVFPLTALFVGKILDSQTTKRQWWAIGLGAILSWILYLNFYYFIMTTMTVTFMVVWKWQLSNLKYWILTCLSAGIFLIPWLIGTFQYLKFENLNQVQGFGGAIYYGAELKNFFLPSAYNPIYKLIFEKVGGGIEQTFLHNWERMLYPGLLIILVLGYWIICHRKIPHKLSARVDPWMLGSLFFAVLALGPFLKWRGSIELINLEGVGVVLPLPFLLFHYLPGLESLRVPGRFTPGMVFLAVVGGSFLLDYFLKKWPYKKAILALLLLTVFFFDQYYMIPTGESPIKPDKLYKQISQDPEEITVLEIPFTVRDGFRYAGSFDAIGPMQGSLIHHKPIVGGYFARVSDEVMNFYKNLHLTGYLLSITDRSNVASELIPYPYTSTQTNEDLDFLRVKYILIKQEESYTQLVTQVIKEAGGTQIGSDQGYVLYERKIGELDMNSLQYGDGTTKNDGYRTMVAQDTKVLFTSNGKKANLSITLSSAKTRDLEWYLNEEKGGELIVSSKNDFDLGEVMLKPGVNILFLRIKNLEKGEALDKDSGVKIYSLNVGQL